MNEADDSVLTEASFIFGIKFEVGGDGFASESAWFDDVGFDDYGTTDDLGATELFDADDEFYDEGTKDP